MGALPTNYNDTVLYYFKLYHNVFDTEKSFLLFFVSTKLIIVNAQLQKYKLSAFMYVKSVDIKNVCKTHTFEWIVTNFFKIRWFFFYETNDNKIKMKNLP